MDRGSPSNEGTPEEEPPKPHRRTHATSSDVARYAGLFAARTSVMRSSAMRDLMAITSRPEVISLAGGLPDTTTFPPETFAAEMTRIAQTSSARALQYGPTEGFDETKDLIADVMGAEGMAADREEILVTTGGQQALDLICKTLIDPGDVIVAEGPTYPGAVPTFCSYEADTRQVDLDDDGMRIDLLEELLSDLEREGKRPKFIYTVPTFHNPGGVTMSLERRHRLVEIAREREILVVEDSPYGLLRFSGEPLPTLRSLEGGDYVLHVGTLSKILSPGIRVGWICAPSPVMAKLILGKQAADLCTSTLSQFFAVEHFETGDWRNYVDQQIGVYQERLAAMLDALERFFPSQARWSEPQGGLFVWATLPDYIDTTDLLAKALRENVAFVPGEAAFVDGRGTGSMRLNFSAQSPDEIREGIRRIGAVIDDQVSLYETMTGTHEVPAPDAVRPKAGGEVLPFQRREER